MTPFTDASDDLVGPVRPFCCAEYSASAGRSADDRTDDRTDNRADRS
ncbi:hypothetical protein GCM10009839_04670 [Catenulispora yoronensis]|uniref:Uncharacterized protein n=1 Tax=Catenulispora yoronensis TaxID=450799 RepID=A0ABP5F311_9ACTN